MGATKEDEREPRAEFLPRRQWAHPSLGVGLYFEIVDPAERRAQLVLDAALYTENVDLEPIRGIRDVARRALLSAQGRQSSQQGNRNRCRRTGTATGRDSGTNNDFYRETPWRRVRVDGGLEQRVAGNPWRPRDDGVPVAEVLDVEHHRVRALRRTYRNIYPRRHSDIQDPPGPPEPSVGPSTVVTDPHGSRRLDQRSASSVVFANGRPLAIRAGGSKGDASSMGPILPQIVPSEPRCKTPG